MIDNELYRLVDNDRAVLIARKGRDKYWVVSTVNEITFHDDSIISSGRSLRKTLARHADKVFGVGKFSDESSK